MNLQNIIGLFVNPNSVTLYLKDLYRIRNIVRSLASIVNRIRQNPYQILSFVQIFALLIRQITLLINSRGQQSFFIIVFNLLKSIQKHSPPPGFLAIRIDKVYREELRIIKPFYRFLRIYFFTTFSSSSNSLQRGQYPDYTSALSIIL